MIVQSFLRKKSVPNGTSRAGRLILQSDISELCWSPAKWPKFPECFFFSILHTIERWNLPAGFIHILCYFRAISQDSWISFPSYFSETVQESWRSQDSRRFCLLSSQDWFIRLLWREKNLAAHFFHSFNYHFNIFTLPFGLVL